MQPTVKLTITDGNGQVVYPTTVVDSQCGCGDHADLAFQFKVMKYEAVGIPLIALFLWSYFFGPNKYRAWKERRFQAFMARLRKQQNEEIRQTNASMPPFRGGAR